MKITLPSPDTLYAKLQEINKDKNFTPYAESLGYLFRMLAKDFGWESMEEAEIAKKVAAGIKTYRINCMMYGFFGTRFKTLSCEELVRIAPLVAGAVCDSLLVKEKVRNRVTIEWVKKQSIHMTPEEED